MGSRFPVDFSPPVHAFTPGLGALAPEGIVEALAGTESGANHDARSVANHPVSVTGIRSPTTGVCNTLQAQDPQERCLPRFKPSSGVPVRSPFGVHISRFSLPAHQFFGRDTGLVSLLRSSRQWLRQNSSMDPPPGPMLDRVWPRPNDVLEGLLPPLSNITSPEQPLKKLKHNGEPVLVCRQQLPPCTAWSRNSGRPRVAAVSPIPEAHQSFSQSPPSGTAATLKGVLHE